MRFAEARGAPNTKPAPTRGTSAHDAPRGEDARDAHLLTGRLGRVLDEVVLFHLSPQVEERERPRGGEDIGEEADREQEAPSQRRRREDQQERQDEDVDVVPVVAPVTQLRRERDEKEIDDGHEVGLGQLARDDPRALKEHGAHDEAYERLASIEEPREAAAGLDAPRQPREREEQQG